MRPSLAAPLISAVLLACCALPGFAGGQARVESGQPSYQAPPALPDSLVFSPAFHAETLGSLSRDLGAVWSAPQASGLVTPELMAQALSTTLSLRLTPGLPEKRASDLAAAGILMRAVKTPQGMAEVSAGFAKSPEPSAAALAVKLEELGVWLAAHPQARGLFERRLAPLEERLAQSQLGAPGALEEVLDRLFSGAAPTKAWPEAVATDGAGDAKAFVSLTKPTPREVQNVDMVAGAWVEPPKPSSAQALVKPAPRPSRIRAWFAAVLHSISLAISNRSYTAARIVDVLLFRPDATPIAAPVSPGAAEEIRYLNKLGVIRVFFAGAPGFGHQSATLAIVRRLRDLGYTGKLDAVYEDRKASYGEAPAHFGAVRQKLAALLPEFDPKGPDTQFIASLNMTLRPADALDAQTKKAQLGITGGADSVMDFTDVLRVERFLRLGPMDWTGYSDALFFDGRRRREVADNARKALIYPAAADGSVDDAYFERLDAAKFSAAKKRGLAALARAARVDNLLPMYGLAFMSPTMMHSVLLGVADASASRPDLFKGRGVIIPLLLDERTKFQVLENFIEEGLPEGLAGEPKATALNAANAALKKRVRVASIDDPDFPDIAAGLGADQILVVKTGPVPPALFEWLFRRASLPPTLEGKNSMNLARMLGIPYIPVRPDSRGDLLDHLHELDDRPGAEEVRYHLNGITPAMWEQDVAAISAYVVDALTPGSRLRELFTRAQIRQDDYANDKLLRAVAAAMRARKPRAY